MLSIKADLLMLIAMPVVLVVGLVAISAGVNYLHASGSLPAMILATNAPATQTPPIETRMQATVQQQPQPAPAVQQNDNTAAWITLISTLALAALSAITSMFNTYTQAKLRMAIGNAQASLDENTVITKQTKTAVNQQTATVDKIKKDIDESNH